MARAAWVQRIWADLTTKEFLPIKAILFLVSGAMYVLFPFLTIHARSLGVSEKELSLLYAFNPIIALFGPPLTGILADRIGNFKVFLSGMTALGGLSALLYLAIPAARQKVALPEYVTFDLDCSVGDLRSLGLQPPAECDFIQDLKEFNVTFTNCTECEVFRSASGPLPRRGNLESEEVAVTVGSDVNSTFLTVNGWSCPDTLIEIEGLSDPSLASYNVSTPSTVLPCAGGCVGVSRREGVCSNTFTMVDNSPFATLAGYLVVRLLNVFTLATTGTLFNGAAVAILKQKGGDYGLQKVYGSLGSIVLTPISGLLIDVFSDASGRQDFRPAFFLYFALKLAGSICILYLKLDFKMPSNKVMKDFREAVKKPEIITFLMVMLISGACFGVLDTFLFWLLQDMGAKKSLMGITVSVGTAAGIPILLVSGQMIQKLGHVNTIILGFAFYVIRMLGYSLITNPWWSLPFEMLECFTVSLMSTAAVTYTADLSTPATIASLQGMYGGIHYGVGRGLGSLLGGFLIGPLGIRTTFRLMAIVCLVTCIAYFVINRSFFRKHQLERKKRLAEEKQEEKKEEEAQKNAVNMTENDPEVAIKSSSTENGVTEGKTKENVVTEEKTKDNGDKSLKEETNPAFENDQDK
ncbi:major facilitator superfamily domain-containing protein 6-like isoform X1 [Penaeus chinensis]|uniref:major facilitator superfamily domain-containing protein 6-like isoform X1 n=1 Tax=Penaeus chinensis TaxID=139456 RepID=UPI001FB85647|nr:major facilitator superfamily domain-containing protein 6-like isoform X1 [Penaeus chinensis]